MKCDCATIVVAAALLVAKPAAAQASSAMAEALFLEAKRLLNAGRTSEACIKFAESQRLEPATGTLLNLANCHQLEGKTASAWAEFIQAAEQADQKGQTDRAKFAQQQADQLKSKLHMVVFVVKGPSSKMEVKLDQQILGHAALSTPLPVDPGEHRVTVSTPTRTWEHVLKTPPNAGTSHVEIPALEDAPLIVVDEPAPTHPANPAPKHENGGTNGRRHAGLIVGGAGVLALGTGIFFGVRSVLLEQQADDEEATARQFPVGNINEERQREASLRDRDAASTNRTIGFIAGGAGIAALGVGIYLFATSKSEASAKTTGIRDVRITPLAGQHGSGVNASFSF